MQMSMLIGPTEAAKILDVSTQWVTELLRTGKLGGQKVGQRWVIEKDLVEAYKQNRLAKRDETDLDPGRVEKAIRTIRLELELDEPSGIYTVTSPDVPGLVTEGSTPGEISHNVQEALEGLFEVWADLGKEIPPALQDKQVKPFQTADMLVSI